MLIYFFISRVALFFHFLCKFIFSFLVQVYFFISCASLFFHFLCKFIFSFLVQVYFFISCASLFFHFLCKFILHFLCKFVFSFLVQVFFFISCASLFFHFLCKFIFSFLVQVYFFISCASFFFPFSCHVLQFLALIYLISCVLNNFFISRLLLHLIPAVANNRLLSQALGPNSIRLQAAPTSHPQKFILKNSAKGVVQSQLFTGGPADSPQPVIKISAASAAVQATANITTNNNISNDAPAAPSQNINKV